LKIVLFGLGKSGTSALFYKVVNSVPGRAIALFEPQSHGPVDRAREHLKALKRGYVARHVVAKVLPYGRRPVRLADFDRFDRQVLIVRDPRDRLVSELLYRSYHASFARRDEAALRFVETLRRKEEDPSGVPLLRVVEAFESLEEAGGSVAAWLEAYRTEAVARALRFHDERPRLMLFRYEDLVDERFGAMEDYLGFPLEGDARVPETLRRVVRTRGYGAWRHWFTAEDVHILRPALAPFMDRYYPGADWETAPAPRIETEHASLYARRLLDERRALTGLSPLPE